MPQPATEASPRPLEIRKYPNRRYYDVTRSRHLTLEEICGLIREGHDVRVTDSKTGTDITAKVLAQIILELDGEKIQVFPVALLQRLIRANDSLVKEFVDRYFNQALAAFMDLRKQFEEQMQAAQSLPPFYPPVSAWNRAFLEPFGFPGGPQKPAATTSAAGAPAPDSDAPGWRDEVRQLREELKSLRARVGGGPTRKRGKAAPKKTK